MVRICILKKIRLWIVILSCNSCVLVAQELILYDSIFSGFGSVPAVNVGVFEVEQCQYTLMEEEIPFIDELLGIIVTEDGSQYFYGALLFPVDTTLVFNPDYNSGLIGWSNFLIKDAYKQGWTCDENNFTYSAGEGITKKGLFSNAQEVFMGNLPISMQCKGGLTYREGKFYLHSINNQLVEVNMKDPAKSKVVMDFPTGILPIDALTTVQVSCDSSITYAIGRTPDNSKIYKINFNDWALSELCDLPISVVGAGNQTECMLPPCDILVDLDSDNSSFAFRGDFCADSFCIPPVMVADTDVVIVSAFNMIETITLELQGVLDVGQEYLTVGAASNINVIGNNTTLLTLENNGSAAIADFENAIKTVQYHNDVTAVTYGDRRVLVTAYAGGESSLVATAGLPLSNEQVRTLPTVTGPACHGFSDGSITVVTEGGIAPYNYQWEILQQGNFIENLSTGEYPFIVTDSLGCTKPDTVFLHDPDTLLADISYTGEAAICDDSGQLEGIGTGGSGILSYQWDNGVMGNMNSDVGYGSYTLTVQDTNGCTATASYEIPQGDTVLVVVEETVCGGNGIEWNGTLYLTDTLACEILTLPNGCDSTICLSLTVNPVPAVSIVADGDFCEAGEVVLSAGSHTTYQWSTNEFSSTITLSDPGSYSITVTNDNSCTSTATIFISPAIEFDLFFENPSCYGEKDGQVVFENTMGGVPPFQYSIDGGNQFSDNNQFDGLSAGDYMTIVKDVEGCQIELQVTLMAPPEIVLDAGGDLDIDLGENVTLIAFSNLSDPLVSWTPPEHLECPSCVETEAMPLTSTQYEVEVTDSNGCMATDIINITVSDRSSIYAPTVFSPNNDNVNDFFTIYTSASFTEILSLNIFDRWGNMVFSRPSFAPNITENGWDGTLKGEPVQSGVFAFVAEVKHIDGSTESISGEVALIR